MGYLNNSIWIFCMLCFLIECQTQTCSNQINNISTYFGEKSHYVDQSKSLSHRLPCVPKQYWGVFRYDKNEFSTKHYAQLSKDLIENINKKSNCGTEFMTWNNSEEDVLDYVKTTILSIAKSLKGKFSNLFRNDVELDDYVFKDTVSGNRDFITQFMKELLTRNEQYTEQNFTILTNNITDMIRNCSAFETNLKDFGESNSFTQKSEFKKMINDITIKLGYKTNFDLKHLKLIYELCRSDNSILNINSPWCSVFNENHLKLLGYNEDLLSYYTKSYGNKYSKNIGCQIVKEMLTDLENLMERRKTPRAIMAFIDSIQFQTLLTALGVRNDASPINADNYNIKNDYLWRTSEISPIGANFAVVTYDCSPVMQVKFFLNENPITVFDCPDGLCEWEYLYEKLKSITENCTYNFCKNVESSASSKFYLILLTLVCLAIVRLLF